MTKIDDLIRLYRILDELDAVSGGKRYLGDLGTPNCWPRRGVYFFFEPGEGRTGSGRGSRLVRVGTHALGIGHRSTLHQRLRQHAGTAHGSGGNHRGSIFRLLVGEALITRGDCPPCPSWGVKDSIGKAAVLLHAGRAELKTAEASVEAAVSNCLHRMPFLCLAIEDDAGPASMRGFIERNVIALASGFQDPVIDPPSPSWLGLGSNREKVRRSGMWNQRHVDEAYEPSSLDVFEATVERNADQKRGA